jgi:hypothetical protein
MIAIQTVGQIAMERANECAQEVGEKFLRSVKPIYGANAGDPPMPILIGTCMFIKVGGEPFMVTAAHVTDNHHVSTLYVGASSSLQKIEGEFWQTKVPAGGRDDDKLDFAFWRLPDDVVATLSDVVFIEESDLSLNRGTMEGRQFLVLGYPIRRNRKIRSRGHHVRSRAWTYQSSHFDLDDGSLKRMGCSRQDHLFLKYDNRAGDYKGGTDNVISPRGASGGALVDLGLPSLEKLGKETQCVGRLAGLFIERETKPRVLIFVKIHVIVDQIRAFLSASSAATP